MTRERTTDRNSDGAVTMTTEMIVAGVLAIVAAVHVALGLLRGFGWIGTEGIDIPAGPEALQTAAIQPNFWDALLWLIPAIAAGAMAWSLASSQHHRSGAGASPLGPMHIVAYVVGIIALAFIALTLVVGFDLFNQNWTQVDGLLWGLAAIVAALIASAAHAAVPAAVADEDYLVRVVEQRVTANRGGRPATDPGTEPRP